MTRITLSTILAPTLYFLTTVTGCSSMNKLDNLITEEHAKLSKLSDQLTQEAPPIFQATHDMQVELKYRPLNNWLNEITTPAFTIGAVGVYAENDIVSLPGIGKAWLEPAHDTQAHLSFRNAELHGDRSGIAWSMRITADAEARAQFEILRLRGNVLCEGSLPSTLITGGITLTAINGTTVDYSMHLSTPGGIKMTVGCGLGLLGTPKFDVPLSGPANNVLNGKFDLGMKKSGTISLPKEAGGRQIRYTISVVDPSLNTSDESLTIQSNVNVIIE